MAFGGLRNSGNCP